MRALIRKDRIGEPDVRVYYRRIPVLLGSGKVTLQMGIAVAIRVLPLRAAA
jgi:hypothetical protein